MKQSMDAMEKLHAETLDHLHEELVASKDEYQKLKHKSKDIESHARDKWEKKLAKVSAESAKLRAKLDEAAVKNAELRQRVATYHTFKDQLKALVASLEVEVATTKERLSFATEKLQKATADRKGDTDTQVAELIEGHESEIGALVGEVEAVAKDAESLRAQLTKTMAKVAQRDATIAKTNASLAKAEQTNALCFDELAGVRLQVASLTTLQRNQKALESTLQEEELATLRDHVKAVEKLKVDTEKERIKMAREVHLVKHTMHLQQPRDIPAPEAKPCEQCQVYKRAEDERNEKLRVARAAAGGAGEVSELERYELLEARKKLNCSVCQDAPKEVMISKCCHMFCKECMESNLKARNRKCPTCKKMFGQDDVKGVYWA
ncbi:hypothetical protein DYB32_003279 [Aphanomyces invadans]|uniref:E3 ubiquitin protein ligase n=1 Tax=Aphanomyces invadans TaxID=157072 RepID=A0A3R6Z4E1_9STRA|nr:hypothetical protein DYB32_003279 [Aphanomyces invadans]